MNAVERWTERAIRPLKLTFCQASGSSTRERTDRAVVQRKLQTDAERAAGLALYRDPRRVAAKGISVGADPLDAGTEVEEAGVGRSLLCLLLGGEEAEHADAVANGDRERQRRRSLCPRTGNEALVLANPVAESVSRCAQRHGAPEVVVGRRAVLQAAAVLV